ncbi:MAG: redoxin domain-containing protein [Candidatus Eisenbacteria bacterium]|nr:redoxin domain-containing protein [Candidatus Eisenbacteria bacterium]
MSHLGPGAVAPEFSLPRLGGGTIQLDTLLARGPAWVFFLKSTCPTCLIMAPFIERCHREMGERPGSIVAIMEDSAEDAAAFAARYDWTMPVAVEESPWPVSSSYRLFTVPTNFVIGTHGLVTRVGAGFFRTELNETARELLAGAVNLQYELIRAEDGAPEFKPG